jgi:uncharacterized protein YecE (DUF72 family)
MRGRIHIGTSGWSYKHWRGLFYPEKLPARRWLEHYSQQFDSTEINGSFYKLPTPETVVAWKEQAGDGFTFCPKMSRFLTHMKKLREPEEPLQRFFGIFDPLLEAMGPVLIQLPPQLKFNPAVTEHFYSLLSGTYGDHRFAIEVRDEAWLSGESLQLMDRHGLSLVISHSSVPFPYLEHITGKEVYIRFHGPAELYASSYSNQMLSQYAAKILEWSSDGRNVWIYFNNDIHGFAPVDAKRLKDLLK